MWQTIVLDKVLERVFQRLDRLQPEAVTKDEMKQAVREGVTEAAKEPVVVNETNGEKWYQSRVQIGLLVGGVTMILQFFNFDLPPGFVENTVNGILSAGSLGGILYAFWGRRKKNLKPLGT